MNAPQSAHGGPEVLSQDPICKCSVPVCARRERTESEIPPQGNKVWGLSRPHERAESLQLASKHKSDQADHYKGVFRQKLGRQSCLEIKNPR